MRRLCVLSCLFSLLAGCENSNHSSKIKKREIEVHKYGYPNDAIFLPVRDLEKGKLTEIRDFIRTFVPPDSLVFDVGAHIGRYTEIFLDCGAKVVAFEPQIRCLKELRCRFKNNGNIFFECIGLADKNTTLQMYICPNASTATTLSEEFTQKSCYADQGYKWKRKVPIKVGTLDEMIRKYGTPQFCKIDVTNYEYEVLKGLSKPIDCIAFVCSSANLKTAKNCVAYLSKLGYRKFNFSPADRGYFICRKWVRGKQIIGQIEKLGKQCDLPPNSEFWGYIYAKYEEKNSIKISSN